MEWYWLLIICVLYCIGGIFIGSKWPLPFFEKGHRFFGTASKDAQTAIVSIMKENGIKPRKTFEAGITKQVIMSDMQTVVGCFLESPEDLPKHVISIPVRDPALAANQAWIKLNNLGFDSSIHMPLGNDIPFFLIKSNAFLEGGGIAFRKHIFKMPKPTWIPNPI